jgi:transposase InsO family protein
MLELVRAHPRFGYRRIAVLLRREGFPLNFKRAYRLWRKEGLKVPRKRRKYRASGGSRNACHVSPATSRDDVWTWDFLHDRTVDGRPLKWLTLVDEYTRECLALRPSRHLTSEELLDELALQFSMRGVPKRVRSDNGPEFIAKAVQEWLSNVQVQTSYIAPGSPWENGYVESFHSRLRDELVDREEFDTVSHARARSAAWREEYNQHRPHSSLGYQTPAEFARRCAASVRATPSLQQHTSPQPELS